MFASEPKKSPFSADAIGETDFARVDAHVIQAEEYEELPEPTDAMMERADRYDGTTLIRRGRPPKPAPGR